METGILISGTGGQGIIAAGELLSEALFRTGYEVINARSYGSEARGGSCRSEVLVSDSEIYDLQLAEPDVLIALSVPAFRKYQGSAKTGALVIVDSAVLEGLSKDEVRQDVRLNSVPATSMARDLGNVIVANMVLLGAFAGLSEVLSLGDLKEAVNELMRPSMKEINLNALEAGHARMR
ncbi:MAG: 2-oxoacid:acceptor oxidoreductase family protein [Candidatus Bathyarchaeota archaeon]|nr:MAG: 2-oxoacid:acceptor oxidoreductase family protein [Candidatus Bathyarchaeota archaeon]